ncbi:hypothetical protein KNE206_33700 [Kitasatospora sp. NE20-6]
MATDVVARARRTWRRLGVAPPVAAEMAEELAADRVVVRGRRRRTGAGRVQPLRTSTAVSASAR